MIKLHTLALGNMIMYYTNQLSSHPKSAKWQFSTDRFPGVLRLLLLLLLLLRGWGWGWGSGWGWGCLCGEEKTNSKRKQDCKLMTL
jgi:hypothetical protein